MKEDEGEYDRITAMYTISAFAANPLFGTIAAIEALITLFLAIVLSGNVNVFVRASIALIERIALKGTDHRQHHATAH